VALFPTSIPLLVVVVVVVGPLVLVVVVVVVVVGPLVLVVVVGRFSGSSRDPLA